MQTTQKIYASETAKGKTYSEILAARAEFQALSCDEQQGYEMFYAGKLEQEANEVCDLESLWLVRQVQGIELPSDGIMVPIATAKALVENTRLQVRDVSGGSSYGYSYAVCLIGNGTELVSSITQSVAGGWAEQFSLSQLDAIIKAVAQATTEMPRITAE